MTAYKKSYGYLPKPVKKTVDEIVDKTIAVARGAGTK